MFAVKCFLITLTLFGFDMLDMCEDIEHMIIPFMKDEHRWVKMYELRHRQ